MLYLWCGADASKIKTVVGVVVSRHVIEHKIWPDLSTFPPAKEGDTVLAFGAKALKSLQDMGVMPKNRTVTSLREKPVKLNGVTIFVTFDPGLAMLDYARLPEIQWDVSLAIRFENTRSVRPKIGTYKFVESLHEIIQYVEETFAKTGKRVKLACDLETKGLDEYAPGAWIIVASFTVRKGESQVLYFHKGETLVPATRDVDGLPYWEALWRQVHWLLTTDKVSTRGANFKFDSRWMREKWGIHCTNFKFDTLLVGSLLDENRSNSLKLHAKIYTEMGGYEDEMSKYDMGAIEKVPLPEVLNYAGGDTDVTYQVADTMQAELFRDTRLTNFYVNLLHPSSQVFEDMERTGLLVDYPAYRALEQEVREEIYTLSNRMVDCLPHKLRYKYIDQITECIENSSSPMKPKLLKEFLFSKAGLNLKPQMYTEKTHEPSTSVDHLMMFKGNPDADRFIECFQEYGSAAKTLSTYIVGFLKHLRPDGRFHPSYMLFRGAYGEDDSDSGTNTGRTSCKDPALQTIPKHTKWTKKLRRVFIAPPGQTILQLDFSQGELRITAVLAEEPKMLAAYKKKMDLHAITAAELNGYTLEEFMLLPEEMRDELRSGGKAGNFGLIYGMQAPGFREYAFTTYGVSMTAEEAVIRRERFFCLYDRLPMWHEKYKSMARKDMQVRSPLGRVRHLPLIHSKDSGVRSQAERQSINAPVQSCLSDMMQLAMVHIKRQYPDVALCLMTHDSIAAYVPIEDAPMWAARFREIMENLPLEKDFGFASPLVFPVDAEIAVPDDNGVISLATLKKFKWQ